MLPYDFRKPMITLLTKSKGRVHRHKYDPVTGVIVHPDYGRWLNKHKRNASWDAQGYTSTLSSQLSSIGGNVQFAAYNTEWLGVEKTRQMILKQLLHHPGMRAALTLLASTEFHRKVDGDSRYSIALEYCGYEEARYVLRFCDTFMCQYKTQLMAEDASYRLAALHELAFKAEINTNKDNLKELCLT